MPTEEEIAYHEAGHILAYIFVGRHFEPVKLSERCVRPIEDPQAPSHRWELILRGMSRMACTWGGTAAHIVVSGKCPDKLLSAPDGRHLNCEATTICEYAAMDVCRNNDANLPEGEYLRGCCGDLFVSLIVKFLRDERIKPLLRTIATALREREEVSEDDVWQIIAETGGVAASEGEVPLLPQGPE